MVPVDPELVKLLYKPSQWQVTRAQTEHDRRTIYLLAKRNLRLPFMETFDAPALQSSCSRRESSTHAPQALELLNGQLSNDLARSFASRLREESGATARNCGPRFPAGPGPSTHGRGTRPRRWRSSATSRWRISPWRSSTSTGSSMSGEIHARPLPHSRPTRTRREFVRDAFAGFGGLALASLLHDEQLRADRPRRSPPNRPIFRPRRARSSSCSWPAVPATWRRLIPSRS